MVVKEGRAAFIIHTSGGYTFVWADIDTIAGITPPVSKTPTGCCPTTVRRADGDRYRTGCVRRDEHHCGADPSGYAAAGLLDVSFENGAIDAAQGREATIFGDPEVAIDGPLSCMVADFGGDGAYS